MSAAAPIQKRVLLKLGTRKLKKWRPHHGAVAAPDARRRGIVVFNYNQRAISTCPGSTPWCESHGYANKRFFLLKGDLYDANAKTAHGSDRIIEEVESLPRDAWVRIHASGDFDTAAYVEKWVTAALLRPDVRFWAYTRSWRAQAERRAPGIRLALQRLRRLPNVQLFASTDRDTERPPRGWRVAWIDGDKRSQGLACLEQTGEHPDCLSCGYCILGQFGDVVFKEH